jgi:SAM-dependent methyltransferase
VPAPERFKSCCAGLYEMPLTEVLLGSSFHPGGAELTARLAEAALVHRGARVLDVASGRGATAQVLTQRFGCRVTCVDYSQINLARSSAASSDDALLGSPALTTHVCSDAERLPFRNGAFDVVFCECALCTFPDGELAAKEMQRVLVPRGRVAISDITLEREVPAALQGVLGRVLCIAGARSVAAYVELLEQAGFLNVRVRDASHTVLETVDRVEQGLARAERLSESGALQLDVDLTEIEPTLAAAREFARSGGIGYSLFTARTPG